ncbi:hypothetical protein Tco_0858996 [Tanacetum coccineum]|uniref:Uncharacterized protein n=1 Tax=Tanacetum coccineum TaxID=301880 RepID=A0ABQ5BEQ0_9ASTR
MDWEREPRGRAYGDLAVLMDLLHNVNLTCDCRDSWQWNLAKDGKFKVKDLSHMVNDLSHQMICSSQETVWNKVVPKKETYDNILHGGSDSNTTLGYLWQLVTWVTVYTIWKERNYRVFSMIVASIN